MKYKRTRMRRNEKKRLDEAVAVAVR